MNLLSLDRRFIVLTSEVNLSEEGLLARCRSIEGLTFLQLASVLNRQIPGTPCQRKGWGGLAIEMALGATAGTQALPDFTAIGVELKTMPVNQHGEPAESTFVTHIPLLSSHEQEWSTSACYNKLKRILWVPVEGDRRIPLEQRRIGQGFLWSPSQAEETVLKRDWEELTTLIGTGHLEEIDAKMGEYLQVRPKAANAKSTCYGLNAHGEKIRTLPRGFYLRRSFTRQILSRQMANVLLPQCK